MTLHRPIAIVLTLAICCPAFVARPQTSESLADVARRNREAAEKRASANMTFSNDSAPPANNDSALPAENPFEGVNKSAAGYEFKTIPRQWPDCRAAQADTVGKSLGSTEMSGKPNYSGDAAQSNGGWTFTGKITIDPTITVTLPDWVNIPNDLFTRAAWRNMIDTLRMHEEGHVNIFKELIQQLNGGTIIGTGPNPTAAQQAAQRYFTQVVKSAWDATNAKQERYDAVTDHGRKQSAVGGTDVRFGCP